MKNIVLMVGVATIHALGVASESWAAHAPGCFVENEDVHCYNAAGIQQKNNFGYKVASSTTDGDKLIVTRTDGNVIEFTYDTSANTVTNNYISGNLTGTTNTYTFDNNGTKIYHTTYQSSGNYGLIETYDANGNKTSERQCSNGSTTYSISTGKCSNYSSGYDYTYDSNGNKTSSRTCASGATYDMSTGKCSNYSSGTDYTYDSNGNKTSYRICDSYSSTGNCTSYTSGSDYSYNSDGNVVTSTCSSFNSSGDCISYKEAVLHTPFNDTGMAKVIYHMKCDENDVCQIYNSYGYPMSSVDNGDKVCLSGNSYCFDMEPPCSNRNLDGTCTACMNSHYVLGNGECHTCGSAAAACEWDGEKVVDIGCIDGYLFVDNKCISEEKCETAEDRLTYCPEKLNNRCVLYAFDENDKVVSGVTCTGCDNGLANSTCTTKMYDENGKVIAEYDDDEEPVVAYDYDDDGNLKSTYDDQCKVESCEGEYREQGNSCVSECGSGWRDMGKWCNKIRWTPAEAAAVLTDDNNNVVTITFKK